MYRILDLSTFLAGPFCTMTLADLGSEVIKIESPHGDPTRDLPPHFHKGESAYFMSCNRGKKSIVLDLKSEVGQRALRDLIRVSDVLVDSYRVGVRRRLGLDDDTLRNLNPRLVHCSISGFGSTGPYADRPAYDMVVQALSGVMSVTGIRGGEPVRTGVPIGDIAAGLYAAIGIMAGLAERERTGVGQAIDVSMLDSQIALLSYLAAYYLISGVVPGPQGGGHISIPTYQTFLGRDGKHFVVTANTEAMWRSLCIVVKHPELAADPDFATNALRQEYRGRLLPVLQVAFGKEPAGIWVDRLQEAGVPAALVNDVGEALADPQVVARGMILEIEHALGGKVRLPGNPIKRASNTTTTTSPPTLGAHTEEVLRSILGWSDEDVAQAMGIP